MGIEEQLIQQITLLQRRLERLETQDGGIVKLAEAADGATIDFQSISQAFRHLRLVVYARGDTAANTTAVYVTFNGDGGANYDRQGLYGTGSTASASESLGATSMILASMPAGSAGANLFGAAVADIAHYANSANNKALIAKGIFKYGTASGNLQIEARANFWRSNSAITRITLTPAAGNFASGTLATLYGIP